MGDEEQSAIYRHADQATQPAPVDRAQTEQQASRKDEIIAQLTEFVAKNSLAETVLYYEGQTLETLEKILEERKQAAHYRDEES